MSELAWFRGLPTKPGLYWRNNPAVSFIVRAEIVEIDGQLNLITQNGLQKVRAPMDTFWWFGPVPDLPGKARR
jgi:hypothetical protein